jgi:hypothetical protein
MPSLVTIDLCGCLKLENLPLLANMSLSEESIDVIYASAENFDLSSDELISSYYLSSLIFLDLSFCNLSTVPDAIGELMHLERLNLEGNNFVSLPPSIGRLSSLAYLNLAHCSWLQSLPELQLCATSLSGGNYFKMISGSHNHRSGLYIFNCPLLEIAESHNLSLSWMMKLIEVRTSHFFPFPPSSFSLVLIYLFFFLIGGTRILVISGVALTLLFLDSQFHGGFIINLQKIQDYE